MDVKTLNKLVNWVCKNNPGIPKEAVRTWLSNINDALALGNIGKEAAVKMQAQKLLGEALGVARMDPKDKTLGTKIGDGVVFDVPGF